MDQPKINPLTPILSAAELFELVEQLRAHGFTIEPRHHFQAQRALDLALALQLQGSMPSLARLQTLLAPIFCHTPEQQATFYIYFREWLQRHTEIQARLQTVPAPLPPEPGTVPPIPPPRTFWTKYKLLGLSLGLIFLGSLVYWRLSRPPKPVTPERFLTGQVVNAGTQQPLPDVKVKFLTITTTTNDAGHFTLKLPARDTTANLTTEAVAFLPETLHINTVALAGILKIKLKAQETITKSVLADSETTPEFNTVEDRLRAMVTRINAFAAKENSGLNHSWFVRCYRRYFKPIQWSLLLGPGLVFAIWYGLRWRRRRLILERFASPRTHAVQTVVVQGVADYLFHNGLVRGLVQRYRRHREVASPDLDLPRTIQATLQQGGLFTPHYAARYWLPEYLVLIDRTSLQDQRARFLDEMLLRFRKDGVAIERYFFERDPRVCQAAAADAAPLTLPELLSKHPQHRLLIFSESTEFLNIRTAKPHAWLEQFLAWAHPAIFLPPAQTGAQYLERELKNLGFQIWPVSLDGLARHIDWIHFPQKLPVTPPADASAYPELLETRLDLWLSRTEPDVEQEAQLIRALNGYLGVEGMFWLGACAVYPELQWELTLWLVTELTLQGAPLLTDAELLQLQQRLLDLTRLPWFRYGFMPDWLRERLLLELNPAQHRRIKQALDALFFKIRKVDREAAGTGFKLPFVPPHPRDQLADLIDIIRNWMGVTDRESPLQDYVFLNYMTGSHPRKLAVLIPKTVQQLFFRKGCLFFGLKSLAAWLFALGFGLVSWVGLTFLEPKQILIPTFHIVLNQDPVFQNQVPSNRGLPYASSDSTVGYYLGPDFNRTNLPDTTLSSSLSKYQERLRQILADSSVLGQRLYFLHATLPDSNQMKQMANFHVNYFVLTLPVFRFTPDSLDESAVRQMLKKYSFYDRFRNSVSLGFTNNFQLSADSLVVYDRASDLTWQRGGSTDYIPFLAAQAYVDSLNRVTFASYRNWRLPTLEEVMSLVEPQNQLGFLIDPIFDARQWWIWTTDKHSGSATAWGVSFVGGSCYPLSLIGFPSYVRAVRSGLSSGELPKRLNSDHILTLPVTFRSTPDSLDVSTVKLMLTQYNFYSREFVYELNKAYSNPEGAGFANDFQVSPDSLVVYDRASGLTWQRRGSDFINLAAAQRYVDSLNQMRFAGYRDWRLPTLEEAMSLMEPQENQAGRYIGPIFGTRQSWIWTADRYPGSAAAWVVDFYVGICTPNFPNNSFVRAVRSGLSSQAGN